MDATVAELVTNCTLPRQSQTDRKPVLAGSVRVAAEFPKSSSEKIPLPHGQC